MSTKSIVHQWRGALPVWISFGGFSTAAQHQNGLSLDDYFDQWLHQNGADGIRPLFKKAIKYGEVLLLIDGLDEGQEPHAAQQAMDRITAFLSIHPIPCVLTSRPRGYGQMRLDGAWPLARLASFDEKQIEYFAVAWFKYIEPTDVTTAIPANWSDSSTKQRADEFLKAIRQNPHIMDLARTPLFCQLLIDVFRFSHQLPEKRIKVYDRIVESLLSEHPSARIHASGVPVRPNVPSTEDMREMLMRLALQMQSAGGASVISTKDCESVFRAFLVDDVNGPGYSPYEAQRQVKSIVDYAQTGLGLLVERAPGEIGFFHQTVQEYLAAQAMVRRTEKEQIEWLTDVWFQSRWHETVIAWFSIVGSEQGKETTQRAIDHLKQIALSPLAQLQLLQLRTELAAGDLGLSPREARATIEEAADEVEITPFLELRRELTRRIALGLRLPSVAVHCEKRLADWVPARPEWDRVPLLSALGEWDKSDDLRHTLVLALHDDSGRCRWTAAESLAKVFASDKSVGEELVKLARNSPHIGIQVAALRGLGVSWQQHDLLDGLTDSARRSHDMDLSLTGIGLRVAKVRQDAEDRERIWFMFTHGSVSFEMQDYCRMVLVQGWNKDQELRRSAIELLRDRWGHSRFLEDEQIVSFLAESWPGDSEVGSSIAAWFESSRPSLLMHDQTNWRNLFRGFRSNGDLSPILRKALSHHQSYFKNDHWDPDAKWASCVIGDDAAKAEVLEAYASVSDRLNNKYWIVSTLMEAWPNDSEVKALLQREFHRPPGEVTFLAPWIDSFITKTEDRREWLLEAIRASDGRFIRSAAQRLFQEFKDEECLDTVLVSLQEKDLWYYHKIELQGLLISTFPHVPELRKLAESSFCEIDGPSLAYVAAGYRQDPPIRERLLKAARPAKADARTELYNVCGEYSIPDGSVLRLTQDIWAEEMGEVRTAGIIARCIVDSRSLEQRESLLTKLLEETEALGTYYEMRRRSALAGLLQLHEYDKGITAITKDDQGSALWIASYHDNDPVATRLLFQHRDALYEAAKSQSREFEIPWAPLIYNGAARAASPSFDERTLLIEYLRTMHKQDRSSETSESLTLMAELTPRSPTLRIYLIEAISKTDQNNSLAFEAQRIFAEQFGGDQQALAELLEHCNKCDDRAWMRGPYPAFLYALALGWPDSPLLNPYLGQKDIPQDFPLIIALALSGIDGNTDHALMCIDRCIEITIKDHRPLPVVYSLGLRKWAESDHAEVLLRRLMDDGNPSHEITATSLLATVGRMSAEDRIALIRRFDEMPGLNDRLCRAGVDLVHGVVTTLPQVIFRLVTGDMNVRG